MDQKQIRLILSLVVVAILVMAFFDIGPFKSETAVPEGAETVQTGTDREPLTTQELITGVIIPWIVFAAVAVPMAVYFIKRAMRRMEEEKEENYPFR